MLFRQWVEWEYSYGFGRLWGLMDHSEWRVRLGIWLLNTSRNIYNKEWIKSISQREYSDVLKATGTAYPKFCVGERLNFSMSSVVTLNSTGLGAECHLPDDFEPYPNLLLHDDAFYILFQSFPAVFRHPQRILAATKVKHRLPSGIDNSFCPQPRYDIICPPE